MNKRNANKINKWMWAVLLLLISILFILVSYSEAHFRLPPFSPPAVTQTSRPTALPEVTLTAGKDFSCWTAPNIEKADPSQEISSFRLLVFFQSKASSREDVYLFDSDTGRYTQIIEDVDPSTISPISRDGHSFWYTRFDSALSSDVLYVYDLEKGKSIRLPWVKSFSSDNSIAWSWDNQCLLVGSKGGGILAYRLADLAVQQKIFPGDLNHRVFSLAPNGKWLALFSYNSQVLVFDLKDPDLQSAKIRAPMPNGYLTWSPDSRFLAFAYNGAGDDPLRGWINQVRIEDFSLGLQQNVKYRDFDRGIDPYVIRWTGDGQNLFILQLLSAFKIYNMQTDRIEGILLPDGIRNKGSIDYGLSPDGNHIAFVAEDGQIYTMLTDGNGIKPIPLFEDRKASSVFWMP